MANHTTRAQRINARHDKIWREAEQLKTQTRFNASSREQAADYSVIGQPGDSVYLLVPHNAQAKQNLEPGTERWQWWGGGLAVEHRFIADVVAQLKDEGWRVE